VKVHSHVEYFPGDHAHQPGLRLRDLVMQSAKHVSSRARVVVLNEMWIARGVFREDAMVKTLEEETTQELVALKSDKLLA